MNRKRLDNFVFSSIMSFIVSILLHFPAEAAWMGITVQDNQSVDGTIMGVKVVGVDADGRGVKAGLRADDIILSVDGRAVKSAASLVKTSKETSAGRSLHMTILRKGERFNLTLILTEAPQYLTYYRIGLEQAEKGNNEEAISYFTEAIDLNLKFADAYDRRGNVYMAKKQYDAAIADYTNVIGLNPTSSDAYHRRGRAYEGKKFYDDAIRDYSNAIELKPKFPLSTIIYNDLGFLFY